MSRNEIISTVSQSGGRIKRDALESAFDPDVVDQEVSRGGPLFASTDASGTNWIEVHLNGLKLCSRHCSSSDCDDADCPDLHVCKFHILNKCTFGSTKCKFGHDVTSAHNRSILEQQGLSDLSHSTLQSLFRNNRTEETLPTPCKFYNNEGGCSKPTTGNKACTHLHVCRFFLRNECKFGAECKRSHDLASEEHTRRILNQYGIVGSTNDIINSFQIKKPAAEATAHWAAAAPAPAASPRSRSSEVTPAAAKPSEYAPEICSYYLNGKCCYGGRCPSYHCALPYQWQNDISGSWTDCNNESNERLELLYCSASRHTVSVSGDDSVNFLDMACANGNGVYKLRRLETTSSVIHEHRPFATRWVWWWEDFSGWRPYGEQGEGGSSANVASDQIETAYCAHRAGYAHTMTFKTGDFSYVIDFRKFTQENTSTNKLRKLWRRPQTFISKEEFEKRRKEWHDKPVGNNPGMPSTWEAVPRLLYSSLDLYTLAVVSPQTNEYKDVLGTFGIPLPGKIILVQRIQNPLLWAEYSRHIAEVSRHEGHTAEKYLFHVSSDEEVDGICQQGYAHRETNDSLGRGIYFHLRLPPTRRGRASEGNVKVVIAKVMTGKHTQGSAGLKKPPPVNPFRPSAERYDSVVDDEISPSMHVIFDARQCYPIYVVHWQP